MILRNEFRWLVLYNNNGEKFMNYILILVVTFLLILVSNLFGNKIAKKLNLNNKIQYTALGLATIFAILFFLFIILILLKLSAPIINFMFMMVLLIISVYSLYDIHKVFSYKPMDLLILVLYLVVMVYLSTKITIGEQMSDSNFYFTLVQRNIDSTVIGLSVFLINFMGCTCFSWKSSY